MVNHHSPPPPKERTGTVNATIWLLAVAITGLMLYFGLPPFIDLDEEGNYILSEERSKDYNEKPESSERVEVYRLVAAKTGLYPCLRCPGIKMVKLNAGETWKYGISRKGRSRYPESFYVSNNLDYKMITVTDILTAEQLEKKLIISYPLLPEAQQRMKLYGIFLKRPPGNAKDQ
ncbi:MAG: hypothetical protein J5I98_32320 [Phaeodactylibacter sp.]|nr:hypothetical protein [Phaeodactylibacter sp.]